MAPEPPSKPGKARQFQAPKGTRDFYPADLLRRRYVERLWRDTSVRHGFEEIDGPTFESAELYAVKSGQGILSEMFGVYSGKDEAEVAAIRQGAGPPLGLRPEFTPTLARMYAARAAQLPRPTKWFWMQNCYRAERPQRGRLREFGQWNCDVIGGEDTLAGDAETISVAMMCLAEAGLPEHTCVAKVSDRRAIGGYLRERGVGEEAMGPVLQLLDAAEKLGPAFAERAGEAGVPPDVIALFSRPGGPPATAEGGFARHFDAAVAPLVDRALRGGVPAAGLQASPRIVRGLAYYTGMVFEIIAEGERAVAGGGRYDNLIELFGGPPTPAVGFGMGDVVLSLLLEDQRLMPDERQIMECLSRTPASYRPQAFVIANEKDESHSHVDPLVASLRRGQQNAAWLDRDARKPWDPDRYAVHPMHARRSYKSTRNIGKLLQDASAQRARFAVIVESAELATIKNLDTREEHKEVPLADVGHRLAAMG
ncbi:MAG: ATP phosphoribosyltransferase regulatory subunit [Phycisphaerales bacterium]|nr:ATP phosphoribosyltransferase regulatory subunit [Phycisphaerales bacterium]